ncbi:MAG: DUF1549 domain-containing protein, partial [Pirellulales bacterium]
MVTTPKGALHALCIVIYCAVPGIAATLEISTGSQSTDALHLSGARARRQLIVTETHDTIHDVTSITTWRVEPSSLAIVEQGGMVIPQSNGTGTIIATVPNHKDITVPLVIDQFGNDPPLDFVSQIVPIFTKHGCNGGGCHGKSGGQNGFRLSLLGFEPHEDYEHLVKESRGRRLSLVAPSTSLLLLKAAASVPHGGGKLIEPDSPSHQMLSQWISEGARPSGPNPPQVSHIDVFPKERTMHAGHSQQLRVLAHYADGHIEDVTRLAQYETNAPDLADVDALGMVKAHEHKDGQSQCGTAGVMIRFQSHVAVFRGTLPLDTPIEHMPPRDTFVQNVIDDHVYTHLTKLRLPPSAICDDATFLRRVTLDIAGRLPTPNETIDFLNDDTNTKRGALVDRLLDSDDYTNYFALKWSAILRNKRTNDELHRNGTYAFHEWIRHSLAENKPYCDFVYDILTATGDVSTTPPVIWYRQVSDINQQAEDASQLFMGVRLQCARCHHHPFEKWGTDDYFQLA